MSIEEMIDKYSKLVYKICYDMLINSFDAEDITQEVYISFYKHFDEYGKLQENEIKNILCKIALNKCKDVLKSKAKKIENMTTDNILFLENYIMPNKMEDEILEKEKKENIIKLIKDIKEPYSNILYLYYIKQNSLDEISENLGIKKQTLKMQIYRAKKLLKEKIESIGGVSIL